MSLSSANFLGKLLHIILTAFEFSSIVREALFITIRRCLGPTQTLNEATSPGSDPATAPAAPVQLQPSAVAGVDSTVASFPSTSISAAPVKPALDAVVAEPSPVAAVSVAVPTIADALTRVALAIEVTTSGRIDARVTYLDDAAPEPSPVAASVGAAAEEAAVGSAAPVAMEAAAAEEAAMGSAAPAAAVDAAAAEAAAVNVEAPSYRRPAEVAAIAVASAPPVALAFQVAASGRVDAHFCVAASQRTTETQTPPQLEPDMQEWQRRQLAEAAGDDSNAGVASALLRTASKAVVLVGTVAASPVFLASAAGSYLWSMASSAAVDELADDELPKAHAEAMGPAAQGTLPAAPPTPTTNEATQTEAVPPSVA